MSKLKLIEYCNKRKIINNSIYNLQSISGPHFNNGKYCIKSKTDFELFLKLYYDVVFNHNISTHFLEPSFNYKNLYDYDTTYDSHNIIKIDLDFRFKYDSSIPESELLKHKYTKSDVKEIINIYVNTLKKYVNLNHTITFVNENDNIIDGLEFVLLERDTAYIKNKKENNKEVKDGIHIICPEFAFHISILHKVRNDILKNEKFIEIIDRIGQLNSIEDVLDKSVISTNAWYLYGSGKPLLKPYLITNVYKCKLKQEDDINIKLKKLKDTELTKYTDNKINVIRKLSNFGIKQVVPLINDTILVEIENELDISGTGNTYNKLNEVLGISNGINTNNINIKKPENNSISEHFIRQLLDCLKDKRASNYDDWWKIGQTLYNIHWKNGYFIFKEFSKRVPDKYNEDGCNKIWALFERNYMNNKYQYNIKYLKQLAYIDNKEQFEKTSHMIMIKLLDGIIDIFKLPIYEKKIGDSTISKEIKKIIDNDNSMDFVAIENKQWYYYENHKWILDSEGNKIKMYIKNKILSIFKQYYNNCIEKNKSIQDQVGGFKNLERAKASIESNIQSMDDLYTQDTQTTNETVASLEQKRQEISHLKIEQTMLTERINVAKRLVTYLEDSAKRNIIVKELSNEFYDGNFYNLLDSNKNVFHCKNGVYDLNTCTFRDGVPDDMITISSKNTYISDELRYNDEEYMTYDCELHDFLDKIFPNPELKEYMLNIFALSLSGKTFVQTFNVCTGTGSNGKSANFELLAEVFGEYFCVVSPALLTKSRSDANSASPAVAVLIGKRIVVTEEPDTNESIKTGVMKDAVSGSPMTCRELHKSQKTFTPQYMLFFNCNDKPDIVSTDEGTWRRIRVSPYVSKFCDPNDIRLKNPRKYKNFFVKEQDVKEKYTVWKEVFLNELIKRYISLKEQNFIIVPPQIVQDAIDDYKSGHNVYEGFKKDCLVKTAGERITVGDAFDSFKQYADECNQHIRNINRNTFQIEMDRVLGKLKNNKYWKDWAVIDNYGENNDDDEENNSDSETDIDTTLSLNESEEN